MAFIRMCRIGRVDRVEAALPPSTPDRPVSAVRRKNSLHGLCHKKGLPACRQSFSIIGKVLRLFSQASPALVPLREKSGDPGSRSSHSGTVH